MKVPSGKLEATLLTWGEGEKLFRVHPSLYGSVQFNPSSDGDARFSPLRDARGAIISTIYAGTSLDCALMETVFHDVPYANGPKILSKATHVVGKVYSQLIIRRNLQLIDLSAIPLRKLGISRRDLIESDGTQYAETRLWGEALHEQYLEAEGLTWTSRQADPARALVLFEDRVDASELVVLEPPIPLLLPDGSAILEVLTLAQRLDVLLTR